MMEFLPGTLRGVRVISAVSGGAILAMLLVRHLGPEAGDTPERRWRAALCAVSGPLHRLMCADIRNRALLSPRHLVRGLASGEWDASACLAEEYASVLGQGRARGDDMTPCLLVNTVCLSDGAIVGLATAGRDHATIARRVAAATAIPGVFNPVPLSDAQEGMALPHVDASVADKLGVAVPARLGCGDIACVDGSIGVSIAAIESISAVAAAHYLLAQPVEARRREMLESVGLHIGLRPTNHSCPAIDGRVLASLQEMRTDLDQFTELEFLPLIVAGYLTAAAAAEIDERAAAERLRALETGASGPFRDVLRGMSSVWDAVATSGSALNSSVARETVLEVLGRSGYHAGRDLRSRVTLYRRLGSIETGAFLWVAVCMMWLFGSTAIALADLIVSTTARWLGAIAGPGLAYAAFAIGYVWAGTQLVRRYDPRVVASWRTSLAILVVPLLAAPYLLARFWLGLHREIRHLAELASVAPFGNTVAGRMRWALAEVRDPSVKPRWRSWYLVLLLGCAVVLAYAIAHIIEEFGSTLSIAAVLVLSLWIAAQLMTRGFPRGKP
jgi:predicted acylesterase/phospholipase RssA